MDWRATTNPAVVRDLDSLFGDSVGVVARILADGEFAPFMLTVDAAGRRELRSLGGGFAGGDAISTLQRHDDADALRARSTVLDVTVRSPFSGDAIEVRLEHRDGLAVDVLVPYRRDADGITVDVTAATAAAVGPRLWPAGAWSRP